MKDPWFFIRRKKRFGGIVIGIAKIFTFWITINGVEITIAELIWRSIRRWILKIYIDFIPFDIYFKTSLPVLRIMNELSWRKTERGENTGTGELNIQSDGGSVFRQFLKRISNDRRN